MKRKSWVVSSSIMYGHSSMDGKIEIVSVDKLVATSAGGGKQRQVNFALNQPTTNVPVDHFV